jgi:hypothetical protein
MQERGRAPRPRGARPPFLGIRSIQKLYRRQTRNETDWAASPAKGVFDLPKFRASTPFQETSEKVWRRPTTAHSNAEKRESSYAKCVGEPFFSYREDLFSCLFQGAPPNPGRLLTGCDTLSVDELSALVSNRVHAAVTTPTWPSDQGTARKARAVAGETSRELRL